MRHRLAVLTLVVAVVAGAAMTPAQAPELKDRGTLRVIAAADEYPEMFSWTPGPAPGFEREMLEGFARLHGLDVELVENFR